MHQRPQSIPVVRTAESQVQSLVRELGSQKPCSGAKKKKKKDTFNEAKSQPTE